MEQEKQSQEDIWNEVYEIATSELSYDPDPVTARQQFLELVMYRFQIVRNDKATVLENNTYRLGGFHPLVTEV